MHGNDMLSLRPVREARRTGVDPDAVYGCVDWYLYHDPAHSVRSSVVTASPSAPGNDTASAAISASGTKPS